MSTPLPYPRRFSASNAERFMACPASANLPAAIPGWTEPVVDRNAGAKGKGSKLHKMFEDASDLSLRDLRAFISALEYIADLRSRRRFKQLVEQTFTANWLSSKPTTTVDLALYVADEMHVVDYKTGTILVEVIDNLQLLFYAATLMDLAPRAKVFTLHIVQPWANNNSSWTVTRAELLAFMADAQKAEQKILQGDTTFGPSHACMFCPADPHSRTEKGRPLCPARMQMLYPSRVDEAAILSL